MRAIPTKRHLSDVRTCNRSPSICAFRTMCCSACSDPTRRTRSLARRRQRKTSRGVPVERRVLLPPSRHDRPDGAGTPARRSRGKAADFTETCDTWAPEFFPGLSVQCSYFIGRIRRVTRHGRRAPLVARAGTGWRARRPAHDSPQAHHRRRPTACCRGPGAAPAARLTTSLRRN